MASALSPLSAMFLPTITWRRRYGAVQLRTEFYEFSVMNRARLCEEEEGGDGGVGDKAFWVLHLTELVYPFTLFRYCGGANAEDNHFLFFKIFCLKITLYAN